MEEAACSLEISASGFRLGFGVLINQYEKYNSCVHIQDFTVRQRKLRSERIREKTQ
jgi:hypothetical protein